MTKEEVAQWAVNNRYPKSENNKISDSEMYHTLIKKIEQAINYTHSCKSDSEQLVLFADWLQYNGKWSLPEQQAKEFLKEQQEQN